MASSRLFYKESVGDLVLLDDISIEGIANTLRKRYEQDLIYTYIGPVLISVNPFAEIPGLYKPELVRQYTNKYFHENPPHVFALAEDVYRSLKRDKSDQCIIITGESGSGKTEASKKIMFYISAVSGAGEEITRVKDQLLKSNPVLEAFGNAKTLRNNNSSRFGKYFNIFFNYLGDPIGGKIQTFLLEKSRVISAGKGERNFHIMYQLTKGIDEERRKKFHVKQPDQFKYLSCTGMYTLHSGPDEKRDETAEETANFLETFEAMEVLGFSKKEIEEVISIVSGILWLGEIEFKAAGDKSELKDSAPVTIAAELLQVDLAKLSSCFTERSSQTGKEIIRRNHTMEEAYFTRDALGKSIYFRLFSWIVERINKAIDPARLREPVTNCIGVLDIYGFEIFEKNSFEQFCINYVNEKLQQIFIDLTLKAEQDEYAREKIAWTEISYFNNKIVCDLIENKKLGIISFLNETCTFPKGNDELFLEKISKNFSKHAHFSRPGVKASRTGFIIKHYAGEVLYESVGFVDKNKDLVWNDLLSVCISSKHDTFKTLFPADEIDVRGHKRPPTAGSQFQDQVQNLMDTLGKCSPHYIRCIKPNELKKPLIYDYDRCVHQITYLGLLENVRVRRAGFAFRSKFEDFVHRYKMICPRTWPVWRGSPQDAVREILKEMDLEKPELYQMGVTKVFLKEPNSIFIIEEAREKRLYEVMTYLESAWKAYLMRRWLKEQTSAILLQNILKGHMARRAALEYKSSTYLQGMTKRYIARRAAQEFLQATLLQAYWKRYAASWSKKEYNKATFLQGRWRMFVARRAALEYNTANYLQQSWKGFECRNALKRYSKATALQSLWKGYQDRRLQQTENAARTLQRNWTRYEFAKMVFQSKMATKIQSFVKTTQMVAYVKKTKAATLIQSSWKALQQRQFYKEYQASTKIRALSKIMLTKLWRTRTLAAYKIQAIAKGFLTRKWAFKSRAVFILQANWKRVVYETFFREYRAATKIRLLCFPQYTELLKNHLAAVSLQKQFKSKPYHSIVSENVKATAIQSAQKSAALQELFKESRVSTKIQAFFRGHQSRTLFKEEKAAILIQSIVRQLLAKQFQQQIIGSLAIRAAFRSLGTRYQQLRQRSTTITLYKGRKDRRRLSCGLFLGGPKLTEFLNIPQIKQALDENKEKEVLYCDNIVKVNRDFKGSDRTLIVTANALYDWEGAKGKYKLHNRFEMSNVIGVSMSTKADNFIIIHMAGSIDVVYETNTKTELMTILAQRVKKISSKVLDVKIQDTIEFNIKGQKPRVLTFQSDSTVTPGTYKITKDPKTKNGGLILVGPPEKADPEKSRYIKDLGARFKPDIDL